MKNSQKVIIVRGRVNFGLRFYSNDTSKPMMFCFPFIGGTSSCYKDIAIHIKNMVNIVAIDPPGHGVVKGKLISDINEIVDIYYEGLLKYIEKDKDFYIFGHSLGGLIGYLLAIKFERNGIKPKCIFISALNPPETKVKTLANENSSISNEEIRKILGERGGKYAMFEKSNNIIIYAYMQIIKADYKLYKSFKKPEKLFLESSSYVIFSRDDEIVRPSEMAGWKIFCRACELIEISGEHNYIINHSREIAEIIINKISDL